MSEVVGFGTSRPPPPGAAGADGKRCWLVFAAAAPREVAICGAVAFTRLVTLAPPAAPNDGLNVDPAANMVGEGCKMVGKTAVPPPTPPPLATPDDEEAGEEEEAATETMAFIVDDEVAGFNRVKVPPDETKGWGWC